MIKEELYGSDWQQNEVIELAEVLKRFKVDEKYDQSPKRSSNTNRGNWPPNQDDVILSTLRQRKRGLRLSYGEKIYLYLLLKIKKEDKRQLVQRFGISNGTLSNIQREISREAAPWITQKGLNTR